MAERKPWTEYEDNFLIELIEQNQKSRGQKLKWGDIANKLNNRGSQRTGKQCRQRWHNQLKPGIDNDKDWTQQQQKTLFRVQQKQGNKWALIARQLPGRTDNNIKNYFYSTLRKALRKVNSYVYFHKKQSNYRNVKQFKQQTLSKILSVAQKKYENKINLRNQKVQIDARKIKKLLVQIQRDNNIQPSVQYNQKLEEIVDLILEFNRNCKRRKPKRKDQQDQQFQSSQKSQKSIVQSEQQYSEKPKKKFNQKKQKKQKQIQQIKPKQGNLFQNYFLKKRSNQSNLFQPAAHQPFQLEQSNMFGQRSFNYNPDLAYSYNLQFQKQGDTDSIFKNIRKIQQRRSNIWNQQFPMIQNMMARSISYSNRDDNPLRQSLKLGDSCSSLYKKSSSRVEKQS